MSWSERTGTMGFSTKNSPKPSKTASCTKPSCHCSKVQHQPCRRHRRRRGSRRELSRPPPLTTSSKRARSPALFGTESTNSQACLAKTAEHNRDGSRNGSARCLGTRSLAGGPSCSVRAACPLLAVWGRACSNRRQTVACHQSQG